MKKFITIAFAVALTTFGATAAFAQVGEEDDQVISTPIDEGFTAADCIENDVILASEDDELLSFCFELLQSDNYPPTTPVTIATTTTTPEVTTTAPEVTTTTVDPNTAGDGGEVTTTSTLPPVTTIEVVEGEGGPVTTVAPSPARQGTLPATGGSGSSNLLQGGALMLVAGAVIFVLARRRSTAPAA